MTLGARVVAAVALVAAASRDALACPVCFGLADGPLAQGSNLGIFALLGVTLGMLGAFAAFFYYLRRREQAMTRQAPASSAAAGGPASAGSGVC